MLRSSFNGCDIVVGEPDNQPHEVTTQKPDGTEEVEYRNWPEQGLYPWQVTKTVRGRKVIDFVGHEVSRSAALNAAQEQASLGARDRRTLLTEV